jgi:hypothetical protein
MEKLIIQQSKRQGRLSEFVKSTGETFTLGRGFNNDVILSDHFIAAEQIRFYYEQDQWKIKVLDDTNPVLLNDKAINDDGAIIESGDQLTVGRTHLVLLLSNHEIEHTRTLMLSNWMFHKGLRITLPIVMLLISALLAMFTDYQEITGKVHWGQLAGGGLAYVFFIVLWAGCWALVGRLLRHKPNFFAQLFYTSLMMTVLNVGMLFSGYAEYATTNNIFGYLIEGVFWLFLLSVLLKYNLTYATELKRRGWISFSVVAVLMVFSFSMSYLQERDFKSYPDYSKTIKPPLAKWSSDISLEVYMQDIDIQFDELKKIKSTMKD